MEESQSTPLDPIQTQFEQKNKKNHQETFAEANIDCVNPKVPVHFESLWNEKKWKEISLYSQ